MITPAQRWRRNQLALKKLRNNELLSSSAQDKRAAECDLELDRRMLSEQCESYSQRAEMKRDILLPKWLPQVERYLGAGDVHPFPPLVWCAIWLFDINDFDAGIDYALIAIEQQQPMPENFASSMGAFAADTVREWAEQEYAAGRSVEPYFSRVYQLVTESWQLHEEITAKYYKLAAQLALRGEDGLQAKPTAFSNLDLLERVQELLQKASSTSKKAGVGTLLDKVTARIRALSRE
ncbi:terminase [Enterobacter sp. WCHEn045836]|uniref:phage terminase small subunit n=1 Tax=Enterobacter sp. WCHEn045836 TaxID=2497434 RepID=UPI000F8483F8|nr:phage terminase small subunit [Enterobacter sp. WCHEn045836]RTP98380.1 terminase [Enterobacter sp. WCHEn045836]